MRRFAFALVVVLTATAGTASERLSSAERCSPDEMHFGSRRTYVRQEVINAGSLSSLKAVVTNAPIDVRGDSPSGYTITVCKAAEVEADLDRIRVTVENGELRTSGPSRDENRWSVMVHISAPRGANLDVATENGPLALRDVDGDVEAQTENGPLSIFGGAGNLRATASNGPLSVRLSGNAWRGSLEASTHNGPLSVRVPRDYASGVVVEAQGHGPVSCLAGVCDDARVDRRRFAFGHGPANVHLSTVNGPLTIKDE